MHDQTNGVADTPPLSPAEQIRAAQRWTFTIAPGLTIECRHLAFLDLVLGGTIPLPTLMLFADLNARQGELAPGEVVTQFDKSRMSLPVARQYAVAAAVRPRVVLEPSDDPTVLSLGNTPPDLSDSTLLDMLNEGLSRRLGVDVLGMGLFRPKRPADAPTPAPPGGTVSDAAELLAAAGGPADA